MALILLMTTSQMRLPKKANHVNAAGNIKGHSFIITIEIHPFRTCLERGFIQCSSYLMLIF
jgi:hypothetical protein